LVLLLPQELELDHLPVRLALAVRAVMQGESLGCGRSSSFS
jgi:hypothetical protein